jgi:glutathione synthase/RimK-type ligase-like ATP-grasp enzyme
MYFAYHKRSKPTGELLAAMLQSPHGLEPSKYCALGGNTLIRWGSRVEEWTDKVYYRVVNPCSAIKLCSDKIASIEAMEEAGINTPAWSDDPHILIEEFGYPILGRKRQHARGTDIKLILQEHDLRKRCDYYTRYVPTKREFRIHVVGDKVIRVQGKYLDHPKQAVSHIRNYATGYRFRKPRLRLKPDRLTMAVSAVKSLGLDFGAVDLLVADDGLGYVLEVNTAPSCSPVTMGAYAVALTDYLNLPNEIDLSVVDMVNNDIEEMDSDDEVEGEDE